MVVRIIIYKTLSDIDFIDDKIAEFIPPNAVYVPVVINSKVTTDVINKLAKIKGTNKYNGDFILIFSDVPIDTIRKGKDVIVNYLISEGNKNKHVLLAAINSNPDSTFYFAKGPNNSLDYIQVNSITNIGYRHPFGSNIFIRWIIFLLILIVSIVSLLLIFTVVLYVVAALITFFILNDRYPSYGKSIGYSIIFPITWTYIMFAQRYP